MFHEQFIVKGLATITCVTTSIMVLNPRLKFLIRLLNVSCRALTRLLKALTAGLSWEFRVVICASPRYP
jgi:hypothetical protein